MESANNQIDVDKLEEVLEEHRENKEPESCLQQVVQSPQNVQLPPEKKLYFIDYRVIMTNQNSI